MHGGARLRRASQRARQQAAASACRRRAHRDPACAHMQTSQGSRSRGGNKQHARGGGGGGGGGATFAGYVFLCNPKTEGECFGRGLFGAGGGKMRDMERIKPQTRLFLRNFKTNQLYGWFRGTAPAGLNIQPGAWAPSVNNPSPFPAQIPIEAPDGRRSCALPSELQACRLEGSVGTAMVDQLMSLLRTSGVPATAALAPPVSHICWQWSDGADWVDYSAQLCRKLEISFSRHSSGSTSQRTTSQRGGDICGLVDVGGGRHVDVSTMTQLVTNNQSRRRAVRRVDASTQRELSSQASVREVTAIEAAATQASEQASRQRRLAEQQRLEAQYRTLEKGKARKQQAAEEARRLREEAEAAEAAEKRLRAYLSERAAAERAAAEERARKENEILPGGFKRGDTVVALFSQDGIKPSDRGIVEGYGYDKTGVTVRFGKAPLSTTIDCMVGEHVISVAQYEAEEHSMRLALRKVAEVLAGGFKRGDTVVATWTQPIGVGGTQGGVTAGDRATVMDPASPSCPDQDLLVKFNRTGETMNVTAGDHVVSKSEWEKRQGVKKAKQLALKKEEELFKKAAEEQNRRIATAKKKEEKLFKKAFKKKEEELFKKAEERKRQIATANKRGQCRCNRFCCTETVLSSRYGRMLLSGRYGHRTVGGR